MPPIPTQPPIAERQPHTTTLHGTELHDDYAWLREKDAPRVRAYLEAENAYTAEAMRGTEALAEDASTTRSSPTSRRTTSPFPTATATGST